GRGHAADLDAELTCEPTRRRRSKHACAIGRHIDDLDRSATRARRARRYRNVLRDLRMHLLRGRRIGARVLHDHGGLLLAVASGCGGAFFLDHDEHLADRANLAVLEIDRFDHARAWARQLDGGLIGHHFDDRLVELDAIAFLDLPGDDLTL